MYDVIIVGSGAGGLFLAKLLNNKSVLVIERTNRSGNKLKITGNGKCNFTKLIENQTFIDDLKNHRKFFYSAISKFGPTDIYNYFINQNLEVEIKSDKRVFCKNSAKDLIDILLANNCTYHYQETVTDIKDNTVITDKNNYQAKKIIICTGGLSYPQTGCDGFIFKIAKNLSLETTSPYPVEAKINLVDKLDLMGVSFADVIIYSNNKKIASRGNLMFTQNGISGFSALSISEDIYKNKITDIFIDFIPSYSVENLQKLINNFAKDKELKTFLKDLFALNFAKYIIKSLSFCDDIKIKNLSSKDINLITNTLKKHHLTVKSVNSIKKATITGGGLSLKEINNKNYCLKKYPNIYCLGEAIDLHGPIGGYNLTLAFSQAYSIYLDNKN